LGCGSVKKDLIRSEKNPCQTKALGVKEQNKRHTPETVTQLLLPLVCFVQISPQIAAGWAGSLWPAARSPAPAPAQPPTEPGMLKSANGKERHDAQKRSDDGSL